jgi:hypothetical protein
MTRGGEMSEKTIEENLATEMRMAAISAVMKDVHQNARDKGWWKALEREDGTLRALTADEVLAKCMLVVSEMSEAVEEARAPDFDPKLVYYHGAGTHGNVTEPLMAKIPYEQWKERRYYHTEVEMRGKEAADKLQPKPEGFGIEIADAVIRCFDLADAMGIDLAAAIKLKHEYNKSRPMRHGGKRA